MNKQPHENFNFKKEFKKFITSISGILSSTKNVNVPTKKIEEIQELLKTLERHYEYIKNDEQISIEEKRNTEQLINKYKQDLEELKQSKKHKFNFLSSQQTKSTSNTENEKTTHNKPTTKTTTRLFAVLSDYLNEKVTITETTKNSFDDLTKIYDYLQIFKSFESNHTYKIERYERKNNIIFNYTNYVSGIIDMNKLNRTHFPKTKTGHKDMQDTNEYKRTLQRILSLDNIKNTILNNYGNIGVLKKNEYGAYVQKTSQNNSNNKFSKDFGKRISLKRTDGTELIVIKVGKLKVSKDKKMFEELDQYAIFTHNNYNSLNEHLVYGKINFDKLLEDETYKCTVCNTLLSEQNLSNVYIGNITTYKGSYYINQKSIISEELNPHHFKNDKMQSIDIQI